MLWRASDKMPGTLCSDQNVVMPPGVGDGVVTRVQEGMIIMEGSSGPGCEVLHKMSEWLSYMLSSEEDTPPVKVLLLPI